MARVPLADSALELATSVFSPLDWAETQRLLQPGGALLIVGPARDHLLQLRQRLYAEVREYDDGKHLARVPPGMHLAHSETLEYPLDLDRPEDRADLLAMTPHAGARAPNAARR